MLSFGKSNGLKKALEKVQRHHLLENPEGLLSDEQLAFIDKLTSFKEINQTYKELGLSEFGGLAKFGLNAIKRTLDNVANNQPPAPIVIDLVEKMAHVCLTLDGGELEVKLKDNDIELIRESALVGQAWLDSPARITLLEELYQVMVQMAGAVSGDDKKSALENMVIRK